MRNAQPGWTNVLGVKVTALNLAEAERRIFEWIDRGVRSYVCITGVHGIMESRRNPEIRKIHNEAGMVTPDGMPLVWLSKLAGHRAITRVYGPDLMERVFAGSIGTRHFLYGASTDTLSRLRANLERRYPGAVIVGTHSPPFRPTTPEEDTAEVALIEAAHPDIVWVGLSTPKQERWMATHRSRLSAPVLVGVGAAFDMHAGKLRQAPRVLQVVGLEWAFRLAMEPRRLWRRYMLNNPAFVWAVLLQALSVTRVPVDS